MSRICEFKTSDFELRLNGSWLTRSETEEICKHYHFSNHNDEIVLVVYAHKTQIGPNDIVEVGIDMVRMRLDALQKLSNNSFTFNSPAVDKVGTRWTGYTSGFNDREHILCQIVVVVRETKTIIYTYYRYKDDGADKDQFFRHAKDLFWRIKIFE